MNKQSIFFIGLLLVGFSLLVACSNESAPKETVSEAVKNEIIELDSLNQTLDNTANEIEENMKALDAALEDLE